MTMADRRIEPTSELTALRLAVAAAQKAYDQARDAEMLHAARFTAQRITEFVRTYDGWAGLGDAGRAALVRAAHLDDPESIELRDRVIASREALVDATATWDAAMAEWRRRECEAAERRW